jgi:hypothetical protein
MADEQPAPRKTFDEDCVDRFQELAQDCLLDHPELRNVSVVFCWKGGLNDTTGVRKGLWLGDSGPVVDLPGIFGGLFQSLKMVDDQAARAFQLVQQLREEAQVLGQDIVNKKQELEALEGSVSDEKEEGEKETPPA